MIVTILTVCLKVALTTHGQSSYTHTVDQLGRTSEALRLEIPEVKEGTSKAVELQERQTTLSKELGKTKAKK
jgi:hypothetical protein